MINSDSSDSSVEPEQDHSKVSKKENGQVENCCPPDIPEPPSPSVVQPRYLKPPQHHLLVTHLLTNLEPVLVVSQDWCLVCIRALERSTSQSDANSHLPTVPCSADMLHAVAVHFTYLFFFFLVILNLLLALITSLFALVAFDLHLTSN